ncbi:hypothetical protein [Sinimarinibacterium sp. NLF-5-8]|uniref:WD40/YVTN/BNR-like repeat-containing protein n=1 Tax=Sinimarinibacterium sp. NLF-5-8 TaxID=2698684 RepID=UPI00137BC18B|nr:hypothetical protein [Sinimarinibacterium sp. NLF-5-8]QHS11150.1 hypothetical protein GT972_14035 [Sinimarinibacterium sp. NLF-5-8]
MTQVDAAAAAQKGSLAHGWPSLLLVLCIALAAVYSFWHRPPPDMAPTAVRENGLLINAFAHQGSRLIAVGELGQVLTADAVNGPWTLGQVQPQRLSTLTDVTFVGAQTAVAVGHDGWIVRSTDGGQTWQEVNFVTENAEPLLGVSGPFNGKVFAYGAFGQFWVSDDAGEHWQQRSLNVVGGDQAADSGDEDADPFASLDDDADPFAAFAAGGGGDDDLSTHHLNKMIRAADGTLWLVGERGLIVHSSDSGESWTPVESIYGGSFFGILQVPGSGDLLAYGMRGNAFVSRDGGHSWTKSRIDMPVSLFDGQVDGGGNIILVGSGDMILKSSDRGASFELVSQRDRSTLTAVLPLKDQTWLTAGENGVRRQLPGVEALGSENN